MSRRGSGQDPLRAFFAVELPADARTQALRAAEALRAHAGEGVRWTPAENLHLTVKFLGSIDPDDVERLLAGAQAKLAGMAAFELEFGGAGAFPSSRAARVLWLGVCAGAGALARLARKLDAAAGRIGVERERRPFHAHLTLGRQRTPAPVAVERAVVPAGTPFPVTEVALFQSHLGPGGSTYVPLARLPLGQADAHDEALAPEI